MKFAIKLAVVRATAGAWRTIERVEDFFWSLHRGAQTAAFEAGKAEERNRLDRAATAVESARFALEQAAKHSAYLAETSKDRMAGIRGKVYG